jgi:hypothetical protein
MTQLPKSPGAPLDPAQAAHNRRVIVVVASIFVVVSLAVLVGGFFLVAGQRDMAQRTDRALRSTAWSILCYAAQHGGEFPTSQAQMDAARIQEPPEPGLGWPPNVQVAMLGEPFMPSAESAGLVAVTWPPHGNLAPVIGVRTNVSGIGTVELVNSWLREFAHTRIVPASNPTPPVVPPSIPAP